MINGLSHSVWLTQKVKNCCIKHPIYKKSLSLLGKQSTVRLNLLGLQVDSAYSSKKKVNKDGLDKERIICSNKKMYPLRSEMTEEPHALVLYCISL